jgi:hypothetical protein
MGDAVLESEMRDRVALRRAGRDSFPGRAPRKRDEPPSD